jgi:hypothetical protein
LRNSRVRVARRISHGWARRSSPRSSRRSKPKRKTERAPRQLEDSRSAESATGGGRHSFDHVHAMPGA